MVELRYTPEEAARKAEGLIAQRTEEKRTKKRSYDRARRDTDSYRKASRERQRDDYFRNPDKYKERQLRVRYGMTYADRDALLSRQGGCCCICGRTDPGSNKDWAVDHCHLTQRVRGILCHKCNTGVGLFDDNIETLKAAISYLEKHNAGWQARPELPQDAGADSQDGSGLQPPPRHHQGPVTAESSALGDA
jgi:hypothetical protein